MEKLLIILGPTATGKTDLALDLAKRFEGELVSCDSRQVYRGLDIATGKIPGKFKSLEKAGGYWIVDGVKIWMLDVTDWSSQFSVWDYVEQGLKVIDDIYRRGKMAIIVGGTGLYLRGLMKGMDNLAIPVSDKIRGELAGLGADELGERLKKISNSRFEAMNESDRKNPMRLIRAIEILQMESERRPISFEGIEDRFDVLKLGLMASREKLQYRIKLRVKSRIDGGMIEEAERLRDEGMSLARMRRLGLEYGLLADLLEGKLDREAFINTLGVKIGQYAKRQMVWFKKEDEVYWFDIEDRDFASKLEKKVRDWYNAV